MHVWWEKILIKKSEMGVFGTMCVTYFKQNKLFKLLL